MLSEIFDFVQISSISAFQMVHSDVAPWSLDQNPVKQSGYRSIHEKNTFFSCLSCPYTWLGNWQAVLHRWTHGLQDLFKFFIFHDICCRNPTLFSMTEPWMPQEKIQSFELLCRRADWEWFCDWKTWEFCYLGQLKCSLIQFWSFCSIVSCWFWQLTR